MSFLLDVGPDRKPFVTQLEDAGYRLKPVPHGYLPPIEYVMLNTLGQLVEGYDRLDARLKALEAQNASL